MTERIGVRLARRRTSSSAALPNGPRLSCGARGRKSGHTIFYARRQLQALVRQHVSDHGPSPVIAIAATKEAAKDGRRTATAPRQVNAQLRTAGVVAAAKRVESSAVAVI